MSSELTEINVDLIKVRDGSILVSDSETEAWLPKSQIEYDEDAKIGDNIDINVPEWLAINEGFV